MRTRIVFGRYYDTGSWMHRLDPRAKTAAMLLFAAAVFVTNTYSGISALLLFSLGIVLSVRIPIKMFVRAVKPLMFIMLFILMFNLLFGGGGPQIVNLGLFQLYAGGLQKGLVAASRMSLFVVFAALLSFTTKPQQLTQALGSLAKPLKLFGLSPDRIALMVSVSLRFIPTLFEEAERIWKAQLSRGLELSGRPLRERAKLILSLLVPVTAGAFRRAIDLSDSMEARGYVLDAPRTSYRNLAWGRADTWFVASFLPLLVVVYML